MKQIIAYSLWGKDPKYTYGVFKNIDCRDKRLPNWTIRIYIHTSVPENIINKISERDGVEVVQRSGIAHRAHMDNPGWFWRFELLDDETIDRFLIRDLDSRITERDVSTINEWIKSGKEFHIVRDHPQHNTKIMAGMWGATKDFIKRINYWDMIQKFENMDYVNMVATDQEFLARLIYPVTKDVACIHDNWDRYKEGARKIPHFNTNGEFVGQPLDENDNPL